MHNLKGQKKVLPEHHNTMHKTRGLSNKSIISNRLSKPPAHFHTLCLTKHACVSNSTVSGKFDERDSFLVFQTQSNIGISEISASGLILHTSNFSPTMLRYFMCPLIQNIKRSTHLLHRRTARRTSQNSQPKTVSITCQPLHCSNRVQVCT